MAIVDRIIGRYSALEIVDKGGRLVARRYLVFSRVEHGRDIASAETSEDPVEELAIPLSGRDALAWLYRHFEDLTPVVFREVHARLTRPVDDVGDLA